jgi:transglutaminase-like putative cysteine protease
VKDSRNVSLLKALLLCGAVNVYFWSLATTPGLFAASAGVLGASWLAFRLEGAKLRLSSWMILGVVLALLGQLLAALLSSFASFLPPTFTLVTADSLVLGLTTFGFFLALRLASSRWHAASVLELAVVVGAVAHAFRDHRHMRIHQPRWLSDWAWSRGIEPEAVLAVVGVFAMAVSALLLLRASRARRLLAMMLLLVGGALVLLLGAPPKMEVSKEDELGVRGDGDGDGDGKSDSDKNKDKNNSGGGGKPPEPIAVAVLHDDMPEADGFYFRQAVRSKLVGDRLIEDAAGTFDTDVPTRFPAGSPIDVTTPQASEFHRELRTSMYLLADHAQLFGVGFPTKFSPLPNPNPRRFVAAYDVNSFFLLRPVDRLIGRSSTPADWLPERLKHYTETPADPRYRALSDEIIRDVDPRFVGDDVVKALALKQYLEKNGFYSLAEKNLQGDDPVAQFLFGEMRGYCVHFAHAAVFLLRSQGIPARVAIGYGVGTQQRGAGSAVLIFANEAHAWPEMYLDGVGWVTFDIAPEQSDEPPAAHVDQDLESALGGLARGEPPGGLEDNRPLEIPWELLGVIAVLLIAATVVLAFVVKTWRRVATANHRLVYRAVLDVMSDLGVPRQLGESRERHAERLAAKAPSFVPLTAAHLKLTLGGQDAQLESQVLMLAAQTRAELSRSMPAYVRVGAFFNPIGWWFTR